MPPGNIKNNLNYNEKKVEKGAAQLIHSSGYLKDHLALNFYEKLEGFTRLIQRNNSSTNALHISLNFANADILDDPKLIQIADEYMEKIGFGAQPYLVYRHDDAGHPHMHIVTTSIKADGKRIDTYMIGATKSEKARKEIEISYGLVKAENSRIKEAYEVRPIDAPKVIYSKSETRRAILTVLEAVLDKYHYSSLEEFNAVLRQYNVFANPGGDQSITRKHGGLLYHALDESGKPAGVPIKASLFYLKPTLAVLETKYKPNVVKRAGLKGETRYAIDSYFFRKDPTLDGLLEHLKKQGVFTLVNMNDEGFIYGMTFVNNNSKSVFKGSDLGKNYGAGALLGRLNTGAPLKIPVGHLTAAVSHSRKPGPGKQPVSQPNPANIIYPHGSSGRFSAGQLSMLDILMKPEDTYDPMPYELRSTRKKRKGKRRN